MLPIWGSGEQGRGEEAEGGGRPEPGACRKTSGGNLGPSAFSLSPPGSGLDQPSPPGEDPPLLWLLEDTLEKNLSLWDFEGPSTLPVSFKSRVSVQSSHKIQDAQIQFEINKG